MTSPADRGASALPTRRTPSSSEDRFERFERAVQFSWFASRAGAVVISGLAGVVALVAGQFGVSPAAAVGLAIGLGLIAAIVRIDRRRWLMQDAMVRVQAQRDRAWVRDTGGVRPSSAAEAEIWLGTHQAGTVPQRYRVVAAELAGDPMVLAKEWAAMPDLTAADRASKEQLRQADHIDSDGTADLGPVRDLAELLPDGDERRGLQAWIGVMDAYLRHASGEVGWSTPLIEAGSRLPPARLPVLRSLGLVLARSVAIVAFVVEAVFFSAVALSVARGGPVPASYQRTELATRGDLPAFDVDAVVRALPGIERAVGSATPVITGALSTDAADALIDDGLPTVIWTVDRIDVKPPPGLTDHVWEIEILLARTGLGSDLAILTLRGQDGPRYAYRLDPEAVRAVRAAAGYELP